MVNSKILLNKPVIVEYKGEKFALKQPNFIDYVEYSEKEFTEIEERAKYLYNFFKVPIRFVNAQIIETMHNLLMNYTPKEEVKIEKEDEEEKPDFIITDIDVVYVLAKFLHFYKNYTHDEVYKMPLKLFFDLYAKIDIIQAELDNKAIELYATSAYLKSEKGQEYIENVKKANKKKIKSMYVLQFIDKSKENWEKITNFFSNNEVGKPLQK